MPKRPMQIVPSEQAGYAPGQHQVRYFDRLVGRWFDFGDPRDTRAEAEQIIKAERHMVSLVDGVKAHALAHYDDGGWDVIVECWDDQQIRDVLADALDPIETEAEAVEHFRVGVVAVYADRQADAVNSAY